MDDVDPEERRRVESGEQFQLSAAELSDLQGVERFLRDTDPRFVTRFEVRLRRGRSRRWHPFQG